MKLIMDDDIDALHNRRGDDSLDGTNTSLDDVGIDDDGTIAESTIDVSIIDTVPTSTSLDGTHGDTTDCVDNTPEEDSEEKIENEVLKLR